MSNQRTLSEKTRDIQSTFAIFSELITPPVMREVMGNMTGAQQQAAAEVGDVQAYAALVQASLNLQRVIAANDRAALIAAVLANSGAPAKVVPLELLEGGE